MGRSYKKLLKRRQQGGGGHADALAVEARARGPVRKPNSPIPVVNFRHLWLLDRRPKVPWFLGAWVPNLAASG